MVVPFWPSRNLERIIINMRLFFYLGIMNKKEIYTNYLVKVKEALKKDDFDTLDSILEVIYTSGIPGVIIEEIDDMLREVTLYLELKEAEYKETALEMIKKYEV